MVQQAGESSLIELMDLIAEGETAEAAVSGLAGFSSLKSLRKNGKLSHIASGSTGAV